MPTRQPRCLLVLSLTILGLCGSRLSAENTCRTLAYATPEQVVTRFTILFGDFMDKARSRHPEIAILSLTDQEELQRFCEGGPIQALPTLYAILKSQAGRQATPQELCESAGSWALQKIRDFLRENGTPEGPLRGSMYLWLPGLLGNAAEASISDSGIGRARPTPGLDLRFLRDTWNGLRVVLAGRDLNAYFLNPRVYDAIPTAEDLRRIFLPYEEVEDAVEETLLVGTGNEAVASFAAAPRGLNGFGGFRRLADALSQDLITKKYHFRQRIQVEDEPEISYRELLLVVDTFRQVWGYETYGERFDR